MQARHYLFSSNSSVVVSYTALISNLAAAEARCMKLEQQLQHMRKMLLSVKADRHTMLKEQVRPLACFYHGVAITKCQVVNHSRCIKNIDSSSALSQMQNYA